MSIASEITRIQGNISDSYTAISNKGGTLPATQNSDNLATAIGTIPSGSSPTYYIEKTVDENGKLKSGSNIFNFSGIITVDDYVLSGAYYKANFPSGTSIDLSSLTTISGIQPFYSSFYLTSGISSVDLSSLTTIAGSASCYQMFGTSRDLASVDLSSLTTIAGNSTVCSGMFQLCNSLTSIDLSSLTSISGNQSCQFMFSSCSGLTTVDLSSLDTINGGTTCGNMFASCNSLTSIDLSSLTTIAGSNPCTSMFYSCGNLSSISFDSLNIISTQISPSYGPIFAGCTNLASVSFGGLTASTFSSAQNQLQYLFNNTTGSQATNGCTVHFPSNFDPSDPDHTFDASTLTGYPTFGGSSSYIYVAFDLPATE